MNVHALQSVFVALAILLAAAGCDRPDDTPAAGRLEDNPAGSAEADPCKDLAGNTREICDSEEDGKRNIAAAEAAALAEPSERHTYELAIARADAVAAAARQRCDDLSGNPAVICREEADRVYQDARAEATLQNKLTSAGETERDAIAEAGQEKSESIDAARSETAMVNEKGALGVAETVCDQFSGKKYTDCVADARAVNPAP